jgi:hypothetical protein
VTDEDEDLTVGDIAERLYHLAEVARHQRFGAEETFVPGVVDAAGSIVASLRSQAHVLGALAGFLHQHADEVAFAGAEDESAAGLAYCTQTANDIAAIAAAIRAAARKTPGGSLADRTRIVDTRLHEITEEELAEEGEGFVLVLHSPGQSANDVAATAPLATFDDLSAAIHVARQQAAEAYAGCRISVFEVNDGERLRDPLFSAPGEGGDQGLAPNRDAA